MDVSEIEDRTIEGTDLSKSKFNRIIVVLVSICAVAGATFKIKDDNIVQSMQAAQAEQLDHWNQFQAKSVKQAIVERQVESWRLQAIVNPPSEAGKAAIDTQISRWESEAARYKAEKADLEKKAGEAQQHYDSANFRDDQFDFSDALIGLSIALFAVSSLTESKYLCVIAGVIAAFGIFMGIAGFAGWNIHPGIISYLT